MQILDGKLVAETRRLALRGKITAWQARTGRQPGLAVVLVGEDPASQVYVANKIKACHQVGMQSFEHRLAATTSESELQNLISKLNADAQVHGILVQLPLPAGLNSDRVMSWIDPRKDADGLSVENVGLLAMGRPRVTSCTPAGVMAILEHYHVSVSGKNVVVIGRSQIVGRPMAQLLLQADATVTICHSKTRDLKAFTSQADVVVVAAGKPEFMGRDYFKKGSVVVDVGMHRLDTGNGKTRLCGDVKFSELQDWALAATPVPGGVGPMTITMLLENTFRLAELTSL